MSTENPQGEDPRHEMLDKVAAGETTGFDNILLFNSWVKTGDFDSGIDSLCEYHANLMALHGFMAGFQYVVVSNEVQGDDLSSLQQAAVAMQTIGFGMSLAGTFISLLAMEYLKGVREEPPELQVEGILKNFSFFKLSDSSAIAAALLLTVTTNMLLYEQLSVWLCILVHLITVFLGFRILYFFKTGIIDKQTYGGGRRLFQYRQRNKISCSPGEVEVQKR